MLGKFYNDDCFKIMETIEDHSIDLILCDLPYGVGNWTNPYDWDKCFPLDRLFLEYKRILKPNKTILLFGTEPYSTVQRNAGFDLFKYDIYWIKNKASSPMNAKVKPLRSVEIISVFSQGTTSPGRNNNMLYNPQGLVKVNKVSKNGGGDRMVMSQRKSMQETYIQEYTNYPRDYVNFDCEVGFHPTQKPVKLFEYLINTYSNENDLVLDNCAGSGTTAIACENTNRKWICIEKEKDYFDKAMQRIQEQTKKITVQNFFD